MAFHWKGHKDIWKGEGIYHLTFVVAGRKCILGQLGVAEISNFGQSGGTNAEVNEAQETVAQFPNTDEKNNTEASVSTPTPADPTGTPVGPGGSGVTNGPAGATEPLADSSTSAGGAHKDHVSCVPKLVDAEGHVAVVNLSPFGFAVSKDMQHFELHHPGMKLVAKMIMPDHIHVVVWVQQNGLQTIRQVGHGIRMGLTHLAQQYGVWPQNVGHTGASAPDSPLDSSGSDSVQHSGGSSLSSLDSSGSDSVLHSGGSFVPLSEGSGSVPISGACHASEGEPAGSRPGLVFDQPFIRTLSRKGQLKALIQYVHDNAYRRWMKQQNPELFVLHKDTLIGELRFRSMGNHWLLDWPERQMVECSRSIGIEQLQQLEQMCMNRAQQGVVTFSAAISEGERAIVRKIRDAGYPVVILLKDGFPPVGSDHERFYKPGGVYFQTCLGGNLLLLEAYDESYESPPIVTATEAQLQLKAQERHQSYRALPHSSLRWRYMAGNEIVRCLVDLE